MKRPAENKSTDLSGSLDLFFMVMHVDVKPLSAATNLKLTG